MCQKVCFPSSGHLHNFSKCLFFYNVQYKLARNYPRGFTTNVTTLFESNWLQCTVCGIICDPVCKNKSCTVAFPNCKSLANHNS